MDSFLRIQVDPIRQDRDADSIFSRVEGNGLKTLMVSLLFNGLQPKFVILIPSRGERLVGQFLATGFGSFIGQRETGDQPQGDVTFL